jgi:hypothetical protein
MIDAKLTEHESTLPLSTVPDKIGVIAEFYAAGIYMQRQKPDEPVHAYTTYADLKMAEYITDTYSINDAGRPGKIFTHTDSTHTHTTEDYCW